MLVQTDEQFQYAMMCLSSNDEIAVDTEGSGLKMRYYTDYLMGFCLAVPDFACYIPFRHKAKNISMRHLEPLTKLLESKDLIWHNQKYDWHACRTVGIDPLRFRGKQYDTLLLAMLVNEELYSKELDALGRTYLKKGKHKRDEVKKFGELYGYDNVPVEMYEFYGPQDAILTYELKQVLYKKLVEQELEDVYWNTEQPFTQLLFELEQRAVGVFRDFTEKKAERGTGRMATLKRELKLNPASPKELGRYLLDELGLPVLAHTDSCGACQDGHDVTSHSGRPSFNKRVMADYDDILMESNNHDAQKIAEFRGWQKATSSLYLPLLEKAGPDGKIRTDFRHAGTVTGRISASDPNLQQVPRSSPKVWNGDAKSCFTSGRDGMVLFGYDYSQLELRIAASYGSEDLLLNEFTKPKADPFSALAPRIFGVLTPETRHDTKTFVYANLYGAGLPKIASQLGRTLSETEELYANYKASIPGVMSVSKQVGTLAQSRGWVRYWDGRRRHFRDRRQSYKAWNSVCQGGGAQLVKRAMLRCREFESEDCFMVLQVHDEITFCIREDKVAEYEPLIVKAMTDWPEMGVNLTVEGKEWK
jgi:DNA polymerase-1